MWTACDTSRNVRNPESQVVESMHWRFPISPAKYRVNPAWPSGSPYLYRHRRLRRLELASDLTFDRTAVVSRIFDNEAALLGARREYEEKLEQFHQKKRKSRPTFVPPSFLTFVSTTYVVAFEAPAANDEPPLSFTAVNAHLIYGTMKEREQEFDALVEWLSYRLKAEGRTLTPNFILMGDLNLNFDNPRRDGKRIDAKLRDLNQEGFGNPAVRRIYFPFLDKHPVRKKVLRTNASVLIPKFVPL